MRQQLEICARNIGPAPRDMKAFDKKYVFPPAPAWTKTDELKEVIQNRETIFKQGKVVLSARVMANRSLYYPGDEDSAMDVVWSEDPFFADNPRELLDIALQLGEMRRKNYEIKSEEEKEVVRLVSDQMSRVQSFALPPTVAAGRAVFLSTLLVFRKHLAGGMLSSMFLPIVVCPDKSRAALILPAKFWSDEWKDR